MKYFFWRFLKRCFWIKLNSHYSRIIQGPKISAIRYYYEEWEQRKSKIRNHELYEFVSKSSEGSVLSNRNPGVADFNKRINKETRDSRIKPERMDYLEIGPSFRKPKNKEA